MNPETLKRAALFAAVTLAVCLVRFERALLEVTPARVELVVWTWLPGRLASALLGGLALLGWAGAVALVLHLQWLGLRAARGGADGWRHLRWYRLELRRERSCSEALLQDAQLLLVTVVASTSLTGMSYHCGSSHRVAMDLDAWHYRRTTEYLGLLTTGAGERPLWDVVDASLERRRHEDKDKTVTYTYAVAVLLRDGSTDSLSGPKAECEQAVEAFQRLLASRRATGVERASPPARPR